MDAQAEASTELPSVSVVIPMLNEAAYIDRCIETFDAQDYPTDRFDVFVVDGGSTDGSRERLAELAAERPWLHMVENPDRRASSAFNRGIEASDSSIVCIVGAHAEVGPDFISRSVAALAETGAGGVGGVLRHEGIDAKGTAIGLAMTSKFGMASPFRFATERRSVDTIGHPAYRREVLDEVGPFDEQLERNSDYELNHRIIDAGHELILDPGIVTVYRPRHTLGALARQFYDYGKGKAVVARNHPNSLKARHLVAPAAAAFVAALPLLLASRPGRRVAALSGAVYAGVLLTATVTSDPRRHDADLPTFVGAFPVMHICWGAGFLVGLLPPEPGRATR